MVVVLSREAFLAETVDPDCPLTIQLRKKHFLKHGFKKTNQKSLGIVKVISRQARNIKIFYCSSIVENIPIVYFQLFKVYFFHLLVNLIEDLILVQDERWRCG